MAGGHSVNLEDQAEHWMGPNVPNGGCSTAHAEMIGKTMYHDGKKVQMGLESQALTWSAPTACMTKGSGPVTQRQDGKTQDDLLHYQAEQFFHPPSSPDQPTIAGGLTCSTDTPNTNQPLVRRKLNPIFVEALMRWPTGLSGFERQAMALTRWQQLMRSSLSTLFSQERRQGELF